MTGRRLRVRAVRPAEVYAKLRASVVRYVGCLMHWRQEGRAPERRPDRGRTCGGEKDDPESCSASLRSDGRLRRSFEPHRAWHSLRGTVLPPLSPEFFGTRSFAWPTFPNVVDNAMVLGNDWRNTVVLRFAILSIGKESCLAGSIACAPISSNQEWAYATVATNPSVTELDPVLCEAPLRIVAGELCTMHDGDRVDRL